MRAQVEMQVVSVQPEDPLKITMEKRSTKIMFIIWTVVISAIIIGVIVGVTIHMVSMFK